MNSLYNQALRQFSSIQSDLSRLESDPNVIPAQHGPVTASLTALTRTIDEYESLAKRELIQSKKEKALGRAAKFRKDFKELSTQLARLKQKAISGAAGDGGAAGPNSPARNNTQGGYSTGSSYRSPSAAAESPYSLHARGTSTTYGASPYSNGSLYAPSSLGPNGTSSDPLSAYKMNASAAAMFGHGGVGGAGYGAREGHALREHTFIEQTETQLDAFIAQGREVVGNLVEQRGILKGTQRRLLDAANTMGLSRDVIGYIERRSTQDNIIFAVGAIFTLVCFYYIYKWFG